MTYRTRYQAAKIKARRNEDEDEELRELLRRSQVDLEESLPHAKQEYMGRLELRPVTWRREPDDEVFVTKINLKRNKPQDEIPEFICLCLCGSNLVLWKARRRQMGITHARVPTPSVEQILNI